MSADRQVLDIWMLATTPGSDPISVHGEAVLSDHDMGDAFDQLTAELIPELRRRVTEGQA